MAEYLKVVRMTPEEFATYRPIHIDARGRRIAGKRDGARQIFYDNDRKNCTLKRDQNLPVVLIGTGEQVAVKVTEWIIENAAMPAKASIPVNKAPKGSRRFGMSAARKLRSTRASRLPRAYKRNVRAIPSKSRTP